MALVLLILARKHAEIVGSIKKHQTCIAQAKHDLTHVNVTMKIQDVKEAGRGTPIVAQGFFAKDEIAEICQRHLVDGPLNTRESADRVMGEKNLDTSDVPLRSSVVFKVVQAPRHAAQNGGDAGKAQGALCVGFGPDGCLRKLAP